jgi:hypothetical protein
MYANQLINEAEVQKTWGPIIEEATGITEKSKLSWMSKYCHYHNLNESVYNTVHLNPNMNVQGMNATAFPSDPTTMNNFNNGMTPGSGDRPFSLLPLAMQVAAQTVGLDLVPVVPMQGPMGVLTYLDFVYGGGRIQDAGGKGTDSAPLLVKCGITAVGGGALALNVDDVIFAQAAVTAAGGTSVAPYELTFVGLSRIDGKSIFRVRGNDNAAAVFANTPAPYQQGEVGYEPIYTAIADNVDFYNLSSALAGNAAGEWDGAAELVKALEDHISGFSGNAFESSNVANAAPSFTAESIDGTDPYQRGVGESTPDNIMGLSLFNKSIAAKTFQVAAAVTREQVQDLKQFGIDAVAQVEAVLVNELTQSINKYILDRIFRNGATNAQEVLRVDTLNLSAAYELAGGAGGPINIPLGPGNGAQTGGGNTAVTQSTAVTTIGTGGETQGSLQRRLYTKILAASNLIATRGRRGPATFAVTSGEIATALQDVAGFIAYPLSNTINQAGGSLYPIGALAGVTIYVDPNMSWTDYRVAVGRKGDGNSPGLVFMPYLMAESVETIAEGTMAPKIAVKSRFALVDAGFHPETMYYTLGFNFGAGVNIL